MTSPFYAQTVFSLSTLIFLLAMPAQAADIRVRDAWLRETLSGLDAALDMTMEWIARLPADGAGHQQLIELLTTHGILHLLGYDHAEPEEHAAIEGGDIGLLYVMGVNGQILMHYAALLGQPWDVYINAMREGVRTILFGVGSAAEAPDLLHAFLCAKELKYPVPLAIALLVSSAVLTIATTSRGLTTVRSARAVDPPRPMTLP